MQDAAMEGAIGISPMSFLQSAIQHETSLDTLRLILWRCGERSYIYMKDGLPCARISLLLSLRLPHMGELLVIRFLLEMINL